MKDLLNMGFTDISSICGPGVYVLTYGDEVVWVGQSKQMPARIGKHITSSDFSFDGVYIMPCATADLDAVEALLIVNLNPRYNSRSPYEYYHRIKQPLIGEYDLAQRRRLDWVMSKLGLHDRPLSEDDEDVA